MNGPVLSRKLVLEDRIAVADGMGGQSILWTALGTLWGEMTPGTGRSELVSGREVPRQPWRIVVRAAPVGAPSRPRAEQRLREGTRVFNILSVAERNDDARFLTLYAEEGLAI
ncbi:MAG: head-tail adaptor protein [Pseudomonadota bacterium]